MNLDELFGETKNFLDYYVEGAESPGGKLAAPGSSFTGIRFRAPAVLGIRPEYEPLPNEDGGTQVPAGQQGPAGTGPYLFLDRCPLRKAVTKLVGTTVMAEFVFVTDYPPGRFPDPAAGSESIVRLPIDSFHLIAEECLSKVEDCVESDPETPLNLGYTVTVMSLTEFDRVHG